MKKKFLNTKNVVIGLVSLVLIGASATGVAVFLKDRGEAAAAEQEQVQNLPATGRGEDNNQTGENTTIPSENNTTGDNTQIPTEPSTTEGATPGETTRPGTTGTTTRSRTEEAVAGIEETVRIEERKVFEDLKLSWTTLAIPAITADMGIFKPVLGIEKTATAVVRANQEEQIPVTENNKPMVRAGDTIIYTIKVSNSGNYKATNVVVTDSLDVIFDGKIVPANKELVKIETLDAGKQATLKVGYVVKQEDINAVLETEQNETISKDIINIATATDGKTTVEDEDKTVPVNPDVTISGTKTWVDNNNAYQTRPESIVVNLIAGNDIVAEQEVRPDAEGNWTYTFTNLPKYDDNKNEIIYQVSENELDNYTYQVSEKGYDIKNTIKQDSTVKVEGTKIWIAPAGTEFPEVTIKLLRDGKEYKTTKVTANNTYSFTGLDKYDLTDGHVYSYTVEEVVPTGYTSKQEGNNFVNTIAQDSTVKVEGTKTWIAPAGTEFPEVTIKLLRDGKEYKTTKVTANNTYSFTGLDKYDLTDGHVYSYTVEEVVPTGYTSKQEGNNFVNTIKQEYVSLSGSKIWIDPEGKKHDTITLQVYQNNEPYKVNGVDYSIELADGTTTFSFTGLPKYKVDSEGNYVLVNGKVQLNEYKVVETTGQTGYSVSYSRVTPDNYGNYTQNVTNSLEQTQISFTANKVWVDEGIVANRKNITVELYKNNVATGITKTINKGQTSCTFENLERYTIVEENGKIKSITENKYSVQEKTISGYDEPTYSEVTKNGAEWSQTITNTKTQEKINIEGTKTWNCVPDGETKPTVIVELFRDYKDGDQAIDRTEVVNGKYSFTDLDKFDMENNYREYQYTVREIVPDGYIATYDGHNITNTKQITATKTAETSTGVKEVNIGETIEYKIIITNNTEVATEVTVKDNILELNHQDNNSVEVELDTEKSITLEGEPLTAEEIQALYNGTFKVQMPATATRTIVIPIKVTAGMTGDKIKNTAYVNGKPTNEVINPIERTVAVTKYKNNLASTNIVLVLDVSSSMEGKKIKTAKQAIVDFINTTYDMPENKDVTFTLITFAKREYTEGARGDQQDEKYQYHGGLFEFNNDGEYQHGCGNFIITLGNYKNFETAFNGLLTDRGTNMRAGLEVANKIIYGESENAISKLYPNYDKVVIFFGDGEPYGEENKDNNERGIKEAAGWLKTEKAKVYSIGFGNGASKGTKGYERLKDISSDGKVYTSSNYTQLIKNFSDIISADPVVYPYTIDGNAIVELTAESTQKIVVDEKNPIIIKIGDAPEIKITDVATAEAYKITYTDKKIIWDVKEYSKDTNLRISYHVQ